MSQENHQKFLKHLADSQNAVWKAARWLSEACGYKVEVAPLRKAPKHEDWKKFADDGDIYISIRVEVKRLSVNFTDQYDWPFGKNFIVCAKHSFDRAFPKPYAYVIISADGANAAVVLAATAPYWEIQERTDSRYEKVKQEFYLAPMEHVRFVSLDGEQTATWL